MLEILNIGNEAIQKHVLFFDEYEIEIQLRFMPTVQQWYLNVSYKDFVHTGIKLALGTLHMRSKNMPFDFVLRDNSNGGVDPFRINDFYDGRISLFLVDADDMEELRGGTVEI